MTAPWLHIVGLGEDGMSGLSSAARALVRSADVILGADRHHELTAEAKAERLTWPSPFDAMVEAVRQQAGRRVVVLVTGDPLWYSAGQRLGAAFAPEEVVYHPQVSGLQWAASRMGWPLADIDALTVHGRKVERIIPYLSPGARLLILARDGSTPAEICRILSGHGYGGSKLTALAHLGGPQEARFEGTAMAWTHEVPDFHTLAVECVAEAETALLSRTPGLPDDAFGHDGKLTKREVRAATLAKLCPLRGALLWDVGLGCGSVAIEWMRAASDARAIGIEPRQGRRAMAAANALSLGAPDLEIIEGSAPEALAGLAAPDAVFIGGGLSEPVFDACWAALKTHGRLVANTVTLESETVLLQLFEKHGGELSRISVNRASPVGRLHGWHPMMPVLQWSLNK